MTETKKARKPRSKKPQDLCGKRLMVGSCLERLKDLPDESIDSVVTDPPYELGFMGKAWDGAGVAYSVELWAECLRVLKPGGHLLAFGATRTYHRMACAIEDAGFEIRDSIHWVYGSGFPKSLDVSKAIDKQAGAEREVIGSDTKARSTGGKSALPTEGGTTIYETWNITTAATDAAKTWQGWGTALKPAHEPIVMARKPLTGTVAATVLAHGTGALNIDGCRVACSDKAPFPVGVVSNTGNIMGGGKGLYEDRPRGTDKNTAGRWPANIILDEAAGVELDAQSGTTKSVKAPRGAIGPVPDGVLHGVIRSAADGHNDEGGASRFFYCPKPGKKERNAGLDELPNKDTPGIDAERVDGSLDGKPTAPRQNFHPTVKPLALIRYLQRLVTPPGGTTLDPFMGSGTSAAAAILEGFDWKGCEMTAEYLPIIKARVQWATKEKRKAKTKAVPKD